MARGIANLGNTCWLSTAIQLLVRSPQVARVLLSQTSSSEYLERGSSSSSAVANAFAVVLRTHWRGSGAFPLEPVRELEGALEAYKGFRRGEQHDAGEAILAIVEALHELFEELFDSRYENAPSTAAVDAAAWEAWNATNKLSIFTEIFQMQSAQSFDGAQPEFTHSWSVVVQAGVALGAGVRDELLVDVTVDGKRLTRRPRYLPPSLLVLAPTSDIVPEAEVEVGGATYELMAAACHASGHWTALVRTSSGFAVVDDDRVTPALPPESWPTASCCMLRRVS